MAQNVRSMLKILRASCPGLSSVISVQFTLKMCVVAKNYKKTQTKLQINTNFFLGGGRSRPFKIIDVDIIKKHVTNACYIYKQYVCGYFQLFFAKRVNSGKINTF